MSPLQFGFIDAKKTPENLLDQATQRWDLCLILSDFFFYKNCFVFLFYKRKDFKINWLVLQILYI